MELQIIPKTAKIIIYARLLGGLNDTICNVCYSGPITAQVSVQCIMNDRGRIDCDHKLLLQGSWVWETYQQSYEEAKQIFFFLVGGMLTYTEESEVGRKEEIKKIYRW